MKDLNISRGINVIIEDDLYALKESVNNYLAKYEAKVISVFPMTDQSKYCCILEY
jgi:hypothetical protein